MGKLQEKYNRYGIFEWALAILGVIGLGIQIFRYATDSLTDNGVEIFVFCAAVLLILSPLTIVNIIRKARGIDTK